MDNYFILLELSFDPIEKDIIVIENAILNKTLEWQRDSKNPKKSAIAKEYLQKIPDIKDKMYDNKQRLILAKEAMSIRESILKDVSYDILILSSKGELIENDINNIFEKYKRYGISKQYIINSCNINKKDENTCFFDKNIASQLSSYFINLEIENLSIYNLYGLKNTSTEEIIVNKTDEILTKILNKSEKENKDEYFQKIAGIIKNIFSNKSTRESYDEWLSFSYNIKLNNLIDNGINVNGKMTLILFNILKNIFTQDFNIDDNEANYYIINYCKYHEYFLDKEVLANSIFQKDSFFALDKNEAIQDKYEIIDETQIIPEECEIIPEYFIDFKNNLNNIYNYCYKYYESIFIYQEDRKINFTKHPDEFFSMIFIIYSFIVFFSSIFFLVNAFFSGVNNNNYYIIYAGFSIFSFINLARSIYIYLLWNKMKNCIYFCENTITYFKKMINETNDFNIDKKILVSLYDKINIKINLFNKYYSNWFKYNKLLKYSYPGYFKNWIIYLSIYFFICFFICFII